MKQSDNQLMMYHMIVKLVDQVRQYSKKEVSKVLRDQMEFVTEQNQPLQIAQWVYTEMTWDDSPALPRRSDVLDVLKQKRGRCGEYANLLTGLLSANGYKARLVFDFTDHVWTEYWDEKQSIWMPLDSTLVEPRINPPTFRNAKPLTYILAISPSKIEDVTKGYTEEWEEVKKRRGVMSPFIEMLVETFNLGAERKDWE